MQWVFEFSFIVIKRVCGFLIVYIHARCILIGQQNSNQNSIPSIIFISWCCSLIRHYILCKPLGECKTSAWLIVLCGLKFMIIKIYPILSDQREKMNPLLKGSALLICRLACCRWRLILIIKLVFLLIRTCSLVDS